MNFDSNLKSPISEATNILVNYKISLHALKNIKDVDYYRNQMLVVLSERIIKSKTLKEVANMLNLKHSERIRQIEARVKHILTNKMQGYKQSA